ncbi:FadR/GntR family transcriptional regulator [Streptomyces acidiscabies]|uniref:FadR/GntR family transcriptional regulator n=1 Tax=Streptomyces acidiscabies TaxID=42234 RepID=UPI00073E5D4E|nr:FadR/GntR family transcriptional regulator [Streptomyces acidiscabies]GAQ51011.1 HTH-type transcriptional regulator LutR [Streptomyces acidiscabies]GAV38710.1 HTH-type transcriptional regulator LutR [Streptomyces acidiscabies]
MSLADDLAEQLLTAIIDGQYPPDSALPPEGELSGIGGVSRLTVREAVKALRAQNVVRVVRGRGTYVNPPDRWTALEPVVRAASRSASGALSERLIEARRLIENGACELAATRRTEKDLADLRRQLELMREAAEHADTELFVQADIDFHDIVMRASGNLFVPLLFEPFGALLVEGRRETSAVPEIRTHAIAHHERVLAALELGDAEAARAAMDGHMEQTADDLRTHVIKRA